MGAVLPITSRWEDHFTNGRVTSERNCLSFMPPNKRLQLTLLRRLATEAAPSPERLWRVRDLAKVEGYGGQARSAALRSPLSRKPLGDGR